MSAILFLCPVFSSSANLSARDKKIKATAGEGGSIDPSGDVKVKTYTNKTFTITPDKGYDILDVLVDGKSVGAVSTYTFYFVTKDHTIHATFKPRIYIIAASAGAGGEINPSGEVLVNRGSNQSFAINANPGFEIQDVMVDQDSKGAISTYTFTNITADHTIHASFERLLEVVGVSIPNVSMKIGDEVRVTIEVTDDGGTPYSFVSGSVGGYPLEDFRRISSTSYLAIFTITQGGNSYMASQSIPVSGLVISDGVMSSPSYDVPIVQNRDPIDAQAPVVIQLEVPSKAVGLGGLVTMTITADGMDYSLTTGTMVNGIPLSSSRLTLTELPDGLYELSFMVVAGDADVAPGLLEANIVMMDAAGNISNSYQIIEPNTLEIYTALPEATLVGPLQICEGDEIELGVHLRGRSPWSFDLNDGTNTTSFTNINTPDYKIAAAPFQSTTYRVSSVKDVNGVENTDNGDLLVTVNEVSDVEIINLATGYDVEAEPVKLEANIPGGIFSGPGVISATGYFYPNLADTVYSPHTILYTYTNANGCISADSALVYVLGNEGGILIPARAFCKGESPFEINVYNVPAATGSFRLLNSDSEPVAGLTDHGDNTATIAPDLLEIGNYTVEYQYLDLILHLLTTDFFIESVEPPQILNLYDTSYCQNVNPFVLQANVPNVIFEGEGVSGSKDVGFTFNPAEADPGNIWITCTAETENGCNASTRESVIIKYAPQVKFTLASECMPEGGEMVSFENQTIEPLSVETWNWNFGDPGSGANNRSSLPDPTHHYQDPGLKNIILKATSFDGCTASYSMEALVDSKPVADFAWISDCFSTGKAVNFINQTTFGSATLDTIIWTIRSGDETVMDEIGSNSVTDTLEYVFDSPDNFLVTLFSRNRGGCYSELTKEIILRPTIQLDSDGYYENFDDTQGQWTVRSEDQLESWAWGVPDFTGYVQGADRAWFTQLPPGVPDYNERSWIQSPCFDFRGMRRPLIRMDIMRSFFPYLNGAVLQYREANDKGWLTIGNETPGINWYNVNNIINMPGGSSTGWGLEEFIPDTDWVTAAHDLDQVEGKANVDLRVVISTNGQLELGNQGIAVNNIHIEERSKLTLLEHFTNSSDDTARMADDIIDAFAISHSKDVLDLQYHMAYPGNDMMNLNNPDPSSTRSGNYGVPRIPYIVLDGGFSPDYRYDFSMLNNGSLGNHLRLRSLETPVFEIDLNVNWMITGLEATSTVTCLADRFDENVQLYMVVFEHSVTAYTGGNGDTQFRNVVLDMLPTPAGKLLGDMWRKGNSDTRTNIWAYAPYIEDINDLGVAAFLQERSTGRILQAAVNYKDKTVGLPDQAFQAQGLQVYPNPANQLIHVNLGSASKFPGRIELLDMSGRQVKSEHFPSGYQVYQVDIEGLHAGMYILRWIEADQVRGVCKFVKMP